MSIGVTLNGMTDCFPLDGMTAGMAYDNSAPHFLSEVSSGPKWFE